MGACCSSEPGMPGEGEAPTRLRGSAPAHMREPVITLARAHTEGVMDVAALDESEPRLFLSCGEDKQVLLQDSSNGSIVQRWDTHTHTVNRVAYIPKRGLFASASRDLSIRIWRRGAAEAVHVLKGHDLTVSAVQSTNDGAYLASGSRDTTVRVWDVDAGRALFRAHKPQNLVTCMRWFPGSPQNVLVQGAEDLRVRIWDTRAGIREVQVLEGYVYFPVRCVEHYTDGAAVVITLLFILHSRRVQLAMDISQDGHYLLTSSKGFNGVGCEARLWDLRGGAGNSAGSTSTVLDAEHFARSQAYLVREYTGHMQDTSACAFVRGGALTHGRHAFVTASKDGTVRVWDMDSGETLTDHTEVGAGAFTAVAMLPAAPEPATGGRSAAGDAGDTSSISRQVSRTERRDSATASIGAISPTAITVQPRSDSAGAAAVPSSAAACLPTFVASAYNSSIFVYGINPDFSLTCIARTPPDDAAEAVVSAEAVDSGAGGRARYAM